jgi:nicotinate phosphoribosyltransferase
MQALELRPQPSRQHPFLIDTYDTESAARKVVQLAPKLARDGITIRAVRIDSGDLAEHARRVRRIFDAGGLQEVKIFVSGGIDEFALRDLLASKQAPIDGFGIGSGMDTSYDVPTLDCAYKLQEYAGRARRKRSEGKATWPGRKQVYRQYGADGRMADTTSARGATLR